MQLSSSNFDDFKTCSRNYRYDLVPFTKINHANIEQKSLLSFQQSFYTELETVNLKTQQLRRKNKRNFIEPVLKVINKTPEITANKKKDLIAMKIFILPLDKELK